MEYTRFLLQLPTWVSESVEAQGKNVRSVENRMGLAIGLARRNVEEEAGGPFGALVFDLEHNQIVAAGINLVVETSCSVFHAEIVAMILAQQNLGTHDLSGGRLELVTSCEPCAMCLGAIPWSGVRSVVCGARDEDARAAGFDEGEKPANWPKRFRLRGIEVVRDVLRENAAAVMRDYAERGGPIYNPSLHTQSP